MCVCCGAISVTVELPAMCVSVVGLSLSLLLEQSAMTCVCCGAISVIAAVTVCNDVIVVGSCVA